MTDRYYMHPTPQRFDPTRVAHLTAMEHDLLTSRVIQSVVSSSFMFTVCTATAVGRLPELLHLWDADGQSTELIRWVRGAVSAYEQAVAEVGPPALPEQSMLASVIGSWLCLQLDDDPDISVAASDAVTAVLTAGCGQVSWQQVLYVFASTPSELEAARHVRTSN